MKGRLDARFEDRGEQWVKNIPTPVRVWAVSTGPTPTGEELNLGIAGIGDAVAVGRGGNATVYRAHQASMDRTVAIKVLDSSDATTRRRFDRERQAMGRLSQHQGIITIYDSGYTSSGRPYLVMPYFEEGSLQDRIDRDGAVPWEEAVETISKVAEAVDHAHQQGVVHRDLKPSNMMIDTNGNPQVADFGIALLADWAQTYTEQLVLTPAYSAPELLDGVEPTVRSDVYALAATLAALITGSPPFMTGTPTGDTLLALSRRIAEEPPPDLTEFGVPKNVNSVIQRALAKDPIDRPESASRFAAELAGLEATATTTQPRRTRPSTQPRPTAEPQTLIDRIPGGWISIGGALAAVVAVILGVSLLGGSDDPSSDGAGDTGDDGVTTTTTQATTTTSEATSDDGPPAIPGALWGPVALPGGVTHLVGNGGIAFVATVNGELRSLNPSSGVERWIDDVDVGALAIDESNVYVLGSTGALVRRISADNAADDQVRILEHSCVNRNPKMVIADSVLYANLGCIDMEALDLPSLGQLWENGRAANTDITALASDGDPTRSGEEVTAIAGFQNIWTLDASGTRTGLFDLSRVELVDVRVPWLGVELESLGGGAYEATVLAIINDPLPELWSFRGGERFGPFLTSEVEPVLEAETVYLADVDNELAALDLTLETLWTSEGVTPDWPVIVDGAVLYVVDGDQLVTVNSRSGRMIGEPVELGARPTQAPVFAGGAVIVAINDELVAFEPSR